MLYIHIYIYVCVNVVVCIFSFLWPHKKKKSIYLAWSWYKRLGSRWCTFYTCIFSIFCIPLVKTHFPEHPACHWAAWLRHSRLALRRAPRCQPPAAPHCVPLPTWPSCPGKLGSDAMGLCHRLPSKGIGLHPCSPMTTSSVWFLWRQSPGTLHTPRHSTCVSSCMSVPHAGSLHTKSWFHPLRNLSADLHQKWQKVGLALHHTMKSL